MNLQHPVIQEASEDGLSSNRSGVQKRQSEMDDNVSDVSGLISKFLEESDISQYDKMASKIDMDNVS